MQNPTLIIIILADMDDVFHVDYSERDNHICGRGIHIFDRVLLVLPQDVGGTVVMLD